MSSSCRIGLATSNVNTVPGVSGIMSLRSLHDIGGGSASGVGMGNRPSGFEGKSGTFGWH
jgi:hypothetical protein